MGQLTGAADEFSRICDSRQRNKRIREPEANSMGYEQANGSQVGSGYSNGIHASPKTAGQVQLLNGIQGAPYYQQIPGTTISARPTKRSNYEPDRGELRMQIGERSGKGNTMSLHNPASVMKSVTAINTIDMQTEATFHDPNNSSVNFSNNGMMGADGLRVIGSELDGKSPWCPSNATSTWLRPSASLSFLTLGTRMETTICDAGNSKSDGSLLPDLHFNSKSSQVTDTRSSMSASSEMDMCSCSQHAAYCVGYFNDGGRNCWTCFGALRKSWEPELTTGIHGCE